MIKSKLSACRKQYFFQLPLKFSVLLAFCKHRIGLLCLNEWAFESDLRVAFYFVITGYTGIALFYLNAFIKHSFFHSTSNKSNRYSMTGLKFNNDEVLLIIP